MLKLRLVSLLRRELQSANRLEGGEKLLNADSACEESEPIEVEAERGVEVGGGEEGVFVFRARNSRPLKSMSRATEGEIRCSSEEVEEGKAEEPRK
jgi:hypothetical protein